MANPSGQAPAHGYIKDKKAQHYKGKSGAVYVHEYVISAGRCNRDEIGTVIGGVTGPVVGHAIGECMDESGRACMGHALETGRADVPVEWRHDSSHYPFIPRGDTRDGCRTPRWWSDGRKPRDLLACPSGRGEWSFRPG